MAKNLTRWPKIVPTGKKSYHFRYLQLVTNSTTLPSQNSTIVRSLETTNYFMKSESSVVFSVWVFWQSSVELWRRDGHTKGPNKRQCRVRSNEKSTKKVDPFQNWFFVISDHYWTGLGWFKPFFAFRGPIGAVGGQFWVLGVLKGRKFEISKLDHFWPWDAIFLT